MAKTPLSSSLRSLWVERHRSRRTGIAAGALRALHRRATSRPSRRQGLAGGAALAGALALPGPASGRGGERSFGNRDDFAAGQVTEWGGERIDSGHEALIGLAERYALPLDDLLAAPPEGSSDTDVVDGEYSPHAQADADCAEIVEALVADEAAARFPTLFDATPEARALDAMSVYDDVEARSSTAPTA